MLRLPTAVRTIAMLLLGFGLVAASAPAQAALAQDAEFTTITVYAGILDESGADSTLEDGTTVAFPDTYTYLIGVGLPERVTPSPGGSQTFVAFDGVTGEVFDTQTVFDGGTATLTVPIGSGAWIKDAADPGIGSGSVGDNAIVSVVINFYAGEEASDDAASPAPSVPATDASGDTSVASGAPSSTVSLPNTGAGTAAPGFSNMLMVTLMGLVGVIMAIGSGIAMRRRFTQ